MPSLVTERIESVKAGIFGAGAFAVAELTMLIISETMVTLVPQFSSAFSFALNEPILFYLAVGAVSGFLFGVTYRYIIRDDGNSHLNDGAVLAFGLVRGLALVEKNWTLSELLPCGIVLLQSLICFAIARALIDLAIAVKLLKPFV